MTLIKGLTREEVDLYMAMCRDMNKNWVESDITLVADFTFDLIPTPPDMVGSLSGVSPNTGVLDFPHDDESYNL